MEKLKVVLVDDNENFRVAFKKLLLYEFEAQVIGEAANAEEFFLLDNRYFADIIFMDVMMPGIDGISIVKKALGQNYALRFVAVTMHTDQVYLDILIEAGFKGCIFKNDIYNDLGRAIEAVLNKRIFFPSKLPLSK